MIRVGEEGRAALFLAALAACFMGSWWVRGLCPFWGDLSYLAQPWRTFNAEMLEAGRLPLWDPYVYLGMPHAAEMQNGLFYPGSLFFYLGGWADGLRLYDLLQFWLAGFLAYLWLRSLGLRSAPSLAGAAVYGFGGWIWIRVEWPNQLGVLALLPAFLLFSRAPRWWGLAWALAFFSGYPLFAIGGAVAAAATLLILAGRRELVDAGGWRRFCLGVCGAGLWGAGIASCLLIPAVELWRHSTRAHGLDVPSLLFYGFTPSDFWGWISPWIAPGPKRPAAHLPWWTCDYMGFLGAAAAIAGLLRLKRRAALKAVIGLSAVALLLLGRSTGLSLWVWTHAAPLRYLRYPGNLAYLAWPLLAFLCAAGAASLRGGGALFLAALSVELVVYGRAAFPVAPARILTGSGPLASYLESRLGDGGRYLLSPNASSWMRGRGFADWKSRLYGLSNLPYKIRSANNVGEPLVPAAASDFLDFLSSRSSAAAAARYFPWAAVRYLLSPAAPAGPTPLPTARRALGLRPGPCPAGPTPLPTARRALGLEPGPRPAGSDLVWESRLGWEIERSRGLAGSVSWFGDKDGSSIPPGLPEGASFAGRSVPRRDFTESSWTASVSSREPGWLYVAEPRYPGWTFTLVGQGGSRRLESETAAGAFQKIRVPPGRWRLYARYEPWSFRLGLLATLGALYLLYWKGTTSLQRSA